MDAVANFTASFGQVAGRRGARAQLAPLQLASLAVAVAVAAAIQSFWLPTDADVSWLITACERLLSGDRLYVDIFEVNPPAALWMYMPLVWLSHILGLKPEAAVTGAFIALGIGSVAATFRLLNRIDQRRGPALAVALPFVALVLPMALFSEREHAALLLALPALTAVAVIAEGKRLQPLALVTAGLAAGLIVIVKPYFLLAPLFAALWAWRKRGSLRPMLPAMTAAAGAVTLYAVSIIAFASHYFDYLEIVAHTYLPVHNLLWKVLIGPTLFPVMFLATCLLLRPSRLPAVSMTWMLGGLGFLIAAFVQAKNFPNHWLPQSALTLAAVAAILDDVGINVRRRILVAMVLAVEASSELSLWAIRPDPLLAAAVERVAPQHPKIISLSPQLTTGFPLTRNLGGEWVGYSPGLYTASGALYVGLTDPVARQAYHADVRAFARDIEGKSPDIILVDKTAKKWLLKEPLIKKALRGYSPAASTKTTEVWLLRSQYP